MIWDPAEAFTSVGSFLNSGYPLLFIALFFIFGIIKRIVKLILFMAVAAILVFGLNTWMQSMPDEPSTVITDAASESELQSYLEDHVSDSFDIEGFMEQIQVYDLTSFDWKGCLDRYIQDFSQIDSEQLSDMFSDWADYFANQ